MARSVVCCLDYTDPKSFWITPKLADTGLHFAIVRCTPKNIAERYLRRFNLARLRGGFEAAKAARKLDARTLISIGPAATAWCALFCVLFGLRSTIIAHAFNFADLPTGLRRFFFTFAFKRVSRFVVFSTIERSIYSSTFGIPIDRFDFIFCDAEPREISQPGIPICDGSYVSVIGGNARDFQTLLKAARQLPELRFELVVRPENLHDLHVPENVHVNVNLPFDATMNIMLHSRFMVLPLLHSSVPCGHVTIACALHLGKAMAVTRSTGITDYIQDERTGLTVPAGDANALVHAIKRLVDDPFLCQELGRAGREFAQEMCSEQNTLIYFRRLLADLSHVQTAVSDRFEGPERG
jgi:glycosyltransferase involved in cell wall biosynthesis